jgi:hypothetical protein
MADDRGQARDYPAWRPKPASWTKLFGTFWYALDFRKLLLVALGILFTSLGWWIISWIFYACWTEPRFDEYQRESKEQSKLDSEEKRDSWARTEYARAMDRWALVHELAGPSTTPNGRFAAYYNERHPEVAGRNVRMSEGYGGKYRTMPWSENRGPNPFLMTRTLVSGSGPERREVLGQFTTYQLPNVVEPLLKFLGPVYYFFDPRADFWIHLYLVLLVLWFLVVWAFFGGVVTRMTVFQLTGKEGGGVFESIAFVRRRYFAYLLSPIIPLALIGFFVLLCFLFGLLHWIPGFGDIWDGIFWILPLLAGVVITLLLIGMFGYPMMYTTLSVEGSDTFDAMSRSYNYVYESPWHYLWYSLVALAYGAVVVLFVIIVGSLTAYFAKWGVKQFPAGERSPEFLFIYAPESLGWQRLLTEGSDVAVDDFGRPLDPNAYYNYLSTYWITNKIGAFLCSFWVTVLFMFVIGFSYSYFWTAATQIYLLMRKRVDETEMDEVYIEEELPEAPVTPPAAPTPAPTPTPTGPVSVPVDAPTLRQPEPPAPATAPSPSTTPPASTPPETPGDEKPPGT